MSYLKVTSAVTYSISVSVLSNSIAESDIGKTC